MKKDLSGKNVLVSTDFIYFGSHIDPVPDHLLEMKGGIGHRCHKNEPFESDFIKHFNYLKKKYKKKVVGQPSRDIVDCGNMRTLIQSGREPCLDEEDDKSEDDKSEEEENKLMNKQLDAQELELNEKNIKEAITQSIELDTSHNINDDVQIAHGIQASFEGSQIDRGTVLMSKEPEPEIS